MNEEPKNIGKKSWLARALLVVVCFIMAIGLFHAEEDWRGKHDWEKFKREWEAKGEKFDRQSVMPAPVPDDQNFALTPIVSTTYGMLLTTDGKEIPSKDRDTNFVVRLAIFTTYGNQEAPKNGVGNWASGKVSDLRPWQKYYRALAGKTNGFPTARQPQTPAMDVLVALSKYDSTIAELRRAGQLPYSRFPLEYDKEDPAAILLPHLAPLKNCSQVLQLSAIAEVQNGQSDAALEDIQLIFRLNDSIRTEPFLISQLVRIATLNIALQPIYEGLAKHEWSDAQLVKLDADLAKLDFLSDYKLAIRGEIDLLQNGMFDYWRQHPGEIFSSLTGNDNEPKSSAAMHLVPTGWFYQNQLNCARPIVEFYLPVVDANQGIVSPSAVRRANAAVAAGMRHRNPYNICARMVLPVLSGAVKRFAYGQNSVNLARVAIALERYHLVHGGFPESLDSLTPQFMAQVPHDIINGDPLRYSHTTDGQFVLYSVGWNETDDGGTVVFGKGLTPSINTDQGDWVWRYPEK